MTKKTSCYKKLDTFKFINLINIYNEINKLGNQAIPLIIVNL